MHFIEQLFDLQTGQFGKILFGLLTNLIIAALIGIIGLWLTGVLTRFVNRLLRQGETDPSLVSFLTSFLSLALKIMVAISAITQLGIEMTSFLTLLGAAGIAIGMAFSGTLSNFAGGIMILVLKPFEVGDEIEALGEHAEVKEIQIFNTYLLTADHKTLIFPNGPLANGTIINFTKEKTRRIKWTLIFDIDLNLDQLEQIIITAFKEDKRVLTKPAPMIGIEKIADTGIEICVQIWVKNADYELLFHEGQRRILEALRSQGLTRSKS